MFTQNRQILIVMHSAHCLCVDCWYIGIWISMVTNNNRLSNTFVYRHIHFLPARYVLDRHFLHSPNKHTLLVWPPQNCLFCDYSTEWYLHSYFFLKSQLKDTNMKRHRKPQPTTVKKAHKKRHIEDAPFYKLSHGFDDLPLDPARPLLQQYIRKLIKSNVCVFVSYFYIIFLQANSVSGNRRNFETTICCITIQPARARILATASYCPRKWYKSWRNQTGTIPIRITNWI